MDKLIILRSLKGLARYFLILFLVLSILNFGILIGRYKDNTQTIGEFIINKREYKWDSSEGLPLELEKQITDYNIVVKYIWFSLICAFLIMLLDYFIDPQHHFITLLANKLKRLEGD